MCHALCNTIRITCIEQNKFVRFLSDSQVQDYDWQRRRQAYPRSAFHGRYRNHLLPEKHVMAIPICKQDSVLLALWRRAEAKCRDTPAESRSNAQTDFCSRNKARILEIGGNAIGVDIVTQLEFTLIFWRLQDEAGTSRKASSTASRRHKYLIKFCHPISGRSSGP